MIGGCLCGSPFAYSKSTWYVYPFHNQMYFIPKTKSVKFFKLYLVNLKKFLIVF